MVAYSYLNICGVKNFVMLGRNVWNDYWLSIFLKQPRVNSKIPVNTHKIRRYYIQGDSNFASKYISKL